MGAVWYGVAAVLTAAVIAAGAGWWKVRRALIRERAARRVMDGAWARDMDAVVVGVGEQMRRQRDEAAVLADASAVLDRAIEKDKNKRGESDV